MTPATESAVELYIGLMSGTSLDGIDAVLADFGGLATGAALLRGHVHRAYAPELRAELLALSQSGADELHRAAVAAGHQVRACAAAVEELLLTAGVDADAVRAIGSHGQTVRHRPDAGYTIQLNAPAVLAELTGIDVVADFRSRDLAAGGQGAPLVPAFHAAVFAGPQARAVVNLGGIANLTGLPAQASRPEARYSGADARASAGDARSSGAQARAAAGDAGSSGAQARAAAGDARAPGVPLVDDAGVIGFDCGPGNVLIDDWAARHLGEPIDRDGAWAGGGRVDSGLLARLCEEPFFALPPPKSTGRDLFHPAWLDGLLAAGPPLAPRDVQATLTRFTAAMVGAAIVRHFPQAAEVLLCGGGTFNATLVEMLRETCAPRPVKSTADLGVAPDHVEALAFAWLAREHIARRPGNLPAVTGARHPRVLGALYPA